LPRARIRSCHCSLQHAFDNRGMRQVCGYDPR
jgi:hypothetical protein